MDKLAIVGIFYDGYYDIWEDFLELYDKFCFQSPYPFYIVDNVIDLYFNKKYPVKVLHAGENAEYSKRVQMAINNINADKYLILLEDFFFTKEFPQKEIDAILDYMDKYQIKYYSLPLPEFIQHRKKKREKIEKNEEYTITCQPAIWDRDFLKKCIGTANYNAWVFEGIYCKSKMAHTEHFLKKCMIDNRNILSLRHGALQGKMIPDTVCYLKEIGYSVKNKRQLLSQKDYKKHLLKAKIKRFVPLGIQKVIKKRFTMNSVIERYQNEIKEVMKLLNLE